MNAADVLAEAAGRSERFPDDDADWAVDALLAHGEQGVAILPDGTLWALDDRSYIGSAGPLYRLVPLSAEATDDR